MCKENGQKTNEGGKKREEEREKVEKNKGRKMERQRNKE